MYTHEHICQRLSISGFSKFFSPLPFETLQIGTRCWSSRHCLCSTGSRGVLLCPGFTGCGGVSSGSHDHEASVLSSDLSP